MLAAIRWLDTLPFAAGIVVVLGLVVAWFVFKWQFRRRFEQLVNNAVLEVGSSLKDAKVTVHAVKAVPAPTEPSPYYQDDEDECDMEDDSLPWGQEGNNCYSIDVTIEPVSDAKWDPTALSMVPADYFSDEAELSEDMCALHSAEIFRHGMFVPAPEKEVSGPQRVRLLFAVGDGLKALKFANFVTYFGHVDLPAALPKKSPAGSRF